MYFASSISRSLYIKTEQLSRPWSRSDKFGKKSRRENSREITISLDQFGSSLEILISFHCRLQCMYVHIYDNLLSLLLTFSGYTGISI